MGTGGVSAYFYAGDFVEAARRFKAGEPQSYATHDELIRTFAAIGATGRPVDLYSFCQSAHEPQQIFPNVRVTALGGRGHRDPVLIAAFRRDPNPAVICHFPSLALHYHLWRSNKRVLSVLASSFNALGPRGRVNLALLRILMNRPRFDFVANHCMPATELLARAGVRPDKLLAWNIPFHRHPDQRPARTRRVDGGAARLCYVGSISQSKGVGDLLRAIAVLRDDAVEVTATIVGGGAIAEMQALAVEAGIADRVTFTGLVDNDRAFAIMGDSDIVVVPSRHDFQEGFPLVLFEAIASRTPIICSDHPIFATAFRAGTDALLFTARDHRDLARQVARLLADDALYAMLSVAAEATWARLITAADWSMMIREWVAHGRTSTYLHGLTLAAQRR